MFGWLQSKSALSQSQKDWIDQRFLWLLSQFGDARLQRSAILPTEEFFPDRYRATREDADRLFGRVCDYVGVERSRVDLRFFASSATTVGTSSFGPSGDSGSALGVYENNGDLIRVWIEESRLADTESLVSTMSHELGHVLLLADRRCDADLADHEPLTDLLTVFLGFGVFTANSALRESNWQHLNTSGWSMARQGYLTMDELAYALAVYADVREDAGRGLQKYFRGDVKGLFNAELKELKKRHATEAATGKNRLTLRTSAVQQTVLKNSRSLHCFQMMDSLKDDVNLATDEESQSNGDEGQEDIDPYTLGVGHFSHGRYKLAVEGLSEAIEADETDREAWVARARAQAVQRHYEEAASDYSHAIKLDPREPQAYTNRALAFLSLGRYPQAADDGRSAIKLCAEDAFAHFALGLAEAAMGQLELAERALNRAVREAPLTGQIYLARSRVREALGKSGLAESDLAEAIRLDASLADPAWRQETLAGRSDFWGQHGTR